MSDVDRAGGDVVANLTDRFKDGAARVVGGGGDLEHFDSTVDTVDAIGESAAGIDGDSQARGHWSQHNSLIVQTEIASQRRCTERVSRSARAGSTVSMVTHACFCAHAIQ